MIIARVRYLDIHPPDYSIILYTPSPKLVGQGPQTKKVVCFITHQQAKKKKNQNSLFGMVVYSIWTEVCMYSTLLYSTLLIFRYIYIYTGTSIT